MKKHLSIIIPCYNASLYIEECLSSIFSQIDKNVEVIVVNDGSTDDTILKIESMILKKPSIDIRVITQENRGVSAARNRGIIESTGVWVSFIDSDDSYCDEFMQVFNDKIKWSSSDIVEFDANITSLSGERVPFYCSFLVEDKVNVINAMSLGVVFSNAKWFTWSRIYKRELFIVNNILFPEGYNYEDIATIPLCYLHAREVAKVEACLINYRIREGSLSNQKNKNDIDDLIAIMKLYELKKLGYDKDKIKLLALVMEKCFRRIRELAVYNELRITNPQMKDIKSCLMMYKSYYSLKNKIRFRFIWLYVFYSVNLKLFKK